LATPLKHGRRNRKRSLKIRGSKKLNGSLKNENDEMLLQKSVYII
jgi:hypothetical protein